MAARRIWSSRVGGIGLDLMVPFRRPTFQIGAVCAPLRWLDLRGRDQPRAAFDETGKDTSGMPRRGRRENTLTCLIGDAHGSLVCSASVAKPNVSEFLSQNRLCAFGRRPTATPSHFNGERARFMRQRTLGMLHNPSRLSAIRTRNKWTQRTKTQDAEVRFYKPFSKVVDNEPAGGSQFRPYPPLVALPTIQFEFRDADRRRRYAARACARGP